MIDPKGGIKYKVFHKNGEDEIVFEGVPHITREDAEIEAEQVAIEEALRIIREEGFLPNVTRGEDGECAVGISTIYIEEYRS